MKKFLYNFKSLIFCVCEFIVGILIFINPQSFTSAIITALGIVLTVIGVLCVMNYFKMDPETGAMSTGLAKGLILICAGIFCIANPRWIVSAFTIAAVVYGVVMLVSGLMKLQWMVDIIRLKGRDWLVPALGAVSSIILACVILINPFASTAVMWAFVGASMIVEAVIDGIAAFVKIKDNGSDDEHGNDSDSEVEITDL